MRIVTNDNEVILLMRDDTYFEINCPDIATADRLKGVLELGIADIIEEIQREGADSAGPVSGHQGFPREIRFGGP